MTSQNEVEERFKYASTLQVGGSSNRDSQAIDSKESEAVEASHQSSVGSQGDKGEFERLSNEIMELDDIVSCTIINYHGNVMAQAFGEIPEDVELKAVGGSIAAVIWGGLKKVEPVAGPISFVSAIFEKAKFVGIPFPESRIAVILRVSVNIDTFHLRDTVSNYVRYWFQLSKSNPHSA